MKIQAKATSKNKKLINDIVRINVLEEELEFYRPVKDSSGYNMMGTISDADFYGTDGIRFPLKPEDINHDVRERAKRSIGNIKSNI